MYSSRDKRDKQILYGGLAIGTVASITACVYGFSKFIRVARPNQVIVKTGWLLGSKTIASKSNIPMTVHKRTIELPVIQRINYIDINPVTYSFDLHSMSKGKVEFSLPVSFTIGPVSPHEDNNGFLKYAERFFNMTDNERNNTIRGVIEGEARGLTARLTVEEMFEDKDIFKEQVVSKIQDDLAQFGLIIYNANIREMKDLDENNKYFEYRKKRAIETANYSAQIDVAEARASGEIGVNERERTSRVKIAELKADAQIAEYDQRQREVIAAANLASMEAENDKKVKFAQYDSEVSAEKRKIELQRELEEKRNETMLIRLRADEVTVSTVTKEKMIIEADGKAEAIRKIAEAELYKAEQEALGLRKKAEAQADQMRMILEAANNDFETVRFYLGLEKGLPQHIATQSADALREMKPHVIAMNGNSGTDFAGQLLKSVAGVNSFLKKESGFGVERLVEKYYDQK